MANSPKHKWEFGSRLRRNSFGWRSSKLAVQRVKEAVSEIKKVNRKDPVTAAEGSAAIQASSSADDRINAKANLPRRQQQQEQ